MAKSCYKLIAFWGERLHMVGLYWLRKNSITYVGPTSGLLGASLEFITLKNKTFTYTGLMKAFHTIY